MAVRLFPLVHGPYMDRHPLQRYNLVSSYPEDLRAWPFGDEKEKAEVELMNKEEERQKNSLKAAKRRTKILVQTPPWLTKEQREEIINLYQAAAALTKHTGTQHEVDHIVPLRGKNVSGLHVPWNLQILTEQENRQKSNKFEENDK